MAIDWEMYWRESPAGRKLTPGQEIATYYRFTADEYQQMGVVHILNEDDLTELIDGLILERERITPLHAWVTMNLSTLMIGSLGNGAWVSVRNPVRLDEFNEPYPDVSILYRDTFDDPEDDSLPSPKKTHLIIEVMDTSQSYDLEIKLPLYARFGVPEVWTIDVHREILVKHFGPAGNEYRSMKEFRSGEFVAMNAFPSVHYAIDDIFDSHRARKRD
jgi:Uma2 family endonuclease